MATYTVLDNGYIRKENEDGSGAIFPPDESNADYQAYLNRDAKQGVAING